MEATMTKQAQREAENERRYYEHVRREGREAWNGNPDGCYFCGSIHHHSDCCLERGDE